MLPVGDRLVDEAAERVVGVGCDPLAPAALVAPRGEATTVRVEHQPVTVGPDSRPVVDGCVPVHLEGVRTDDPVAEAGDAKRADGVGLSGPRVGMAVREVAARGGVVVGAVGVDGERREPAPEFPLPGQRVEHQRAVFGLTHRRRPPRPVPGRRGGPVPRVRRV